jgi:hypothetical protein
MGVSSRINGHGIEGQLLGSRFDSWQDSFLFSVFLFQFLFLQFFLSLWSIKLGKLHALLHACRKGPARYGPTGIPSPFTQQSESFLQNMTSTLPSPRIE